MGGGVFPDPRVVPVFLICTPAIFIVSVSSAFRGYFQGLQNMLPPALSQTLEQIVRVSCGFSAALYLLPRGITLAATGLALGMLAGEAVGLLAIALQYSLTKHPQPQWREGKLQSRCHTIARIWQLASPVTAGRLLSTGLSALDAMLIPSRLQTAGYTARQATSLFGQLGGVGFTLLSFPSVFTFALAISLVPAVAEATAKRSFQIIKAGSAEVIRVTIAFGLPCIVILFYFAEPLTAFFNSVNIAPVLRVLAIGGIFSYLQQTTTAVLQGLGKAHLPVAHSIAAAGIRLPLLYWLTGLPALGLMGTAWAFVASSVVVAILNIAAIVRQTGMSIDLRRFGLQPLSAAFGMLLAFHLLAPSKSAHVFTYFEEAVVGVLIYLIIMVLNRGITIGDIRRILRL
jgi:stage V sporulation protein B